MATAAMLILGMLLTLSLDFTVAEVGVCYGRNGNNLLSPPQVVDLYKRRNIRRMRTYDPDSAVLDALSGSGIELNVAVTNQYLQYLAGSQDNANKWARDHVHNYPDVNFKYISVGNEVSPANGDTSRYTQFVLPAMINVYRAVRGRGVKVTTSLGMDVVGNSFPPQDGAFRDDVKPYLRPIIAFLRATESPLMMNIYPYFAYVYNKAQIDLGYALLEENHGITVNGVYYDNILYAMVDAVYAAVDRLVATPRFAEARKEIVGGGGGNATLLFQKSGRGKRKPTRTPVVVSESGWPSKGGDTANLELAHRYASNYIDVVDEAGLEAYIFALLDENEKPGAETERNFGIHYPNGEPKFDLDFSS